MTSFDLSPLFRSTVGFDRLMQLIETSSQWAEAGNGYPPYNIEKTGEDKYRVTLAVAGFAEDELNIEVREGALFIEGRRRESDQQRAYVYRGIATRSFRRQFQLADHVQVVGASLDNGLLTIDLVRELPEAMKPRQIAITRGTPAVAKSQPQLVEAEPKAA